MARYFIINTETQTIENTILWDGVTPYEVPEGFELVLVTPESVAQYSSN
jgi:hypothetical protein